MERTKKPDFTNGKVLKNLIFFAIPMAIAALLQMLFNAADVAIVGQFGGSEYQAAVGATSSTVHIIVNLFMGVAIGANVAMANAVGAKDEPRQQKVVHSSIALALVSGFIILFAGWFLSRPILSAIKTPSEIIDYSVVYMQIYFLGAPAMMVYNFGASVQRGVGETKKPVYYLLVAGILNVLINAVTVIFLHLHVIGVALGTTVSQYLAAAWLLFDLFKAKDGSNFSPKKLRFHAKETKTILVIGLPMGLSSCCFSLANLLVQSSVNAYGELAIAGNTVASNLGQIGDAFASSVEKSVVTIVGQNMGAKKPERLHRIIGAGLVACATCQTVLGTLLFLFGNYICMIYNADPVVIEWALKRLGMIETLHILTCGMYIFGGALRGMGYSFFPMFINLFFSCICRILYLVFIYAAMPVQTIQAVYLVYPVTWILASAFQALFYFVCVRKEKRAHAYHSAFQNYV
ncbi:MAG: MATE family efflux transporter [Clostridia bacterium]|nr:MATE family efflux transporter [Clostridia bacterium]